LAAKEEEGEAHSPSIGLACTVLPPLSPHPACSPSSQVDASASASSMLLDAMTAAGLRTVADLRDGLTEEQLALVRRAATRPSSAGARCAGRAATLPLRFAALTLRPLVFLVACRSAKT